MRIRIPWIGLGLMAVLACSGPTDRPRPASEAPGGASGATVDPGAGAFTRAGGGAGEFGRGGSSAGESSGGRAGGGRAGATGGANGRAGGDAPGRSAGSGGALVGSGGTPPAGAGGIAGEAAAGRGGTRAAGGRGGTPGVAGQGAAGQPTSGPIATFSGPLATGITFLDDKGDRVNAHGGGVIKEGDTYYMHGEYFSNTTTSNDFNGFSMYSSKDLATWKWERMILPQQKTGELGPNRKGERPHIIKCPSTGEFVLFAHAASSDYQMDREVVYATSPTVNGDYTYVGPLTNSAGTRAEHSDMSALSDGDNAYVVTESGHVYTLASDCHSWLTDKSYSAVNGDSGGSEAPTVFKAGATYYWIGSYKTGWRANNNFYSTAPAMTGPWTYQGYLAPVADPTDQTSDARTWLSQSTWVIPVIGTRGTVYVYWGDHWDGTQDKTAPGQHNYLATYVFQPLVFTGTAIGLPAYLDGWKLDAGAGTWATP
jgi:hypothetical protein